MYELLCNYRYKRLPWDWRDSRLDYGPSLQKDNHVLSLVIPVPERVFGMQCYCLMIINYVKFKTFWKHTVNYMAAYRDKWLRRRLKFTERASELSVICTVYVSPGPQFSSYNQMQFPLRFLHWLPQLTTLFPTPASFHQ